MKWYEKLYYCNKEKYFINNRDGLAHLYNTIFDMIATDEGIRKFNEDFDNIDVLQLPTVFNIGLIRGTYSFKSRIKGWNAKRDKIRGILRVLGYDADDILVGLYDEEVKYENKSQKRVYRETLLP